MKLRLLALLFLIVFVPAGALTGAGVATHRAGYLTGFNRWQTGVYMVMADVAWALPPSAARAFYNYYPFFFYLPAAKHLQGRFANSKLEHWEPWGRYAAYHSPHLESIGGLVAGGLVGVFPALLVGLFKTDESSDGSGKRKQKPKKQPKAKTQPDSKWLWIGDQRITRDEEIQHILCVGTTRTGKSQVIQTAAKVARKRNEPAFILDYNAELFSRLYDPKRGDILLSAYDKRSEPWSPLAEIQGPVDCNRIAHMIIGDGGSGESAEWAQNARNYASACLLACLILYKRGEHVTNQTLAMFLTQATADDLLGIVGYDHLVASIFQEGAERMLASIQGTAGMRANALMSLSRDAGFDGFSITQHVTEGDRGGAFIYAAATQRAGEDGMSLVSILTGIYVDAVNQLYEDEDRRSWLLFDEAGQYPPIAGFSNGVSTAAKRGLAAVTAVQTVTMLRDIYGHNKAGSLLGNHSTRAMFMSPDDETAAWCAGEIGKARKTKKSHTVTESGGSLQGQKSTSTQQSEQIEDELLAHEIKDLRKFEAYITRPAKTGYCKVTVRKANLGKPVIEPFVERPLTVEAQQSGADGSGADANAASAQKGTTQASEAGSVTTVETRRSDQGQERDDKPTENAGDDNGSDQQNDSDDPDEDAVFGELKS